MIEFGRFFGRENLGLTSFSHCFLLDSELPLIDRWVS